MNNQNTNSIKNQAVLSAQELLKSFASQEGLSADFTKAFGSKFDREAAEELVNQWETGEFDSFPEIEILASDS
ncbi:MAG: hypothetical protein QNJ32_11455 [Xenococcaceae cyanobacterium MO_167.B27]|nr:hypothetical protein [Xenococcaceae cyanobacterium MO_167.B27]